MRNGLNLMDLLFIRKKGPKEWGWKNNRCLSEVFLELGLTDYCTKTQCSNFIHLMKLDHNSGGNTIWVFPFMDFDVLSKVKWICSSRTQL